jgi:exodeoxyribonuclease VII large subunit
LKFEPKEGMTVIVRGRISVYEPRGSYAIDVTSMSEAGIGDFQIAYQKLKAKLFAEGLFNESNKKPLPEFPVNIAIITSESGAVIEDFKRVAANRYPLFTLYLFPVTVQGKGSAESVCRAIASANKYKVKFDIIILARGGGSPEDLWTFNEESVARAIFASEIPIVSAIGHEIDYPISDFVADMRAPTPSAAAEMILPDRNELLESLKQSKAVIRNSVTGIIQEYKEFLNNTEKNYVFKRPKDMMNEFKLRLDEKYEKLGREVSDRIKKLKEGLEYTGSILEKIGPDATLRRGYTYIIRNETVITRKRNVKKGEKVRVRFYDGDTGAEIID